MTTLDAPSGLRRTIDRLTKKTQRQDAQVERLTRMLLMQRIKDIDIDFSDSLEVLDSYRPEFTDVATFDEQFSPEVVLGWLAVRRDR